jgi:hypothetical protein
LTPAGAVPVPIDSILPSRSTTVAALITRPSRTLSTFALTIASGSGAAAPAIDARPVQTTRHDAFTRRMGLS